MFLREHPYVAILCLTAIMSGCVALTAWTRREIAPATKPFTWLMVAIAIYATAAALSASTFSLRPKIIWATCEYFASNSVIALYLTFSLNFTGRVRWLRRVHRRVLIWLLPAANILLVTTNHWHNLVWKTFTAHPEKSHIIVFQHGIGFYWIAVGFYIYVITGSLLVARGALQSSTLYRRQALTVISSAIPPLVAGTIYILGLLPPGINLLPMSFLLTGLIYFTCLFRDRLFDLVPIARNNILEQMSEGIVVIDEKGRVIDMNQAARQYATPQHRKHKDILGEFIDTALSQWPTLAQRCRTLEHQATTIIAKPEIPYYLELRATHLQDPQQRATARVIMLRDITVEQQAQLKIEEANAELTRQLSKNQALRDQLEQQAIRDGLTQLYNRRYFEETISAEFAKARRSGSPLSIILLDIDHFKGINDTYGHLAGDCALRTFARILQQQVRKSDIACRYGGEEFVIALPNMPLEEACKRADSIRRIFKGTLLEFEGHCFNATVSIGVGTVPDVSGIHTLTQSDQLLQKIDQALYRAKKNGRDRIETITPSNPYTRRQLQLEEAIRCYQTDECNSITPHNVAS